MYTDINVGDINLFRGIYNLFRKFLRMFILFLINKVQIGKYFGRVNYWLKKCLQVFLVNNPENLWTYLRNFGNSETSFLQYRTGT